VDRLEAVGRHLVAATLTAALVRGVGDLVAADRDRPRSWPVSLLSAGLGAAVGSLGSYLAWTAHRRRQAAVRRPRSTRAQRR
jgi:ubiquinone biosynthesis protein